MALADRRVLGGFFPPLLRAGLGGAALLCALIPFARAFGQFMPNMIIAHSAQGALVADLYLFDIAGSASVNLTRSPDEDDRYPMWSPDGTRLLFRRVTRRGTQACMITPAVDHAPRCAATGENTLPLRWHPDNAHFYAALTPFDAALFSAESGALVQPVDTRVDVLAYSRDFRFGLVYSTEYTQHMSRITLDAPSQPQELVIGARFSGAPTFSPDSARVAFGALWLGDTDLEIYTVDAMNGSDWRKLTDNQQLDMSPTYSPDGAWIAFVSDRHQPPNRLSVPQLYIMRADGSEARRLTFSSLLHGDPTWKP